MIRLLPPGGLPDFPDPLIGCQIDTLADCYASLGVDCYHSEEGGILCRFGTTLLLSGRCDSSELWEFCALLGIVRIEGISGGFAPPEGWRTEVHPLLIHPPASALAIAPCPAASDRMQRIFTLLCENDSRFAAEAQYLPWLSDLTRRRNRNRARVYLQDECATACLSAISGGYAWLCSVAVSPLVQRSGKGSRLLAAIAADCDAQGLTIATAAQDLSLLSFYRRAGFHPTGQNLLIATENR